jgi:hypothetical protein
MSMAVKPLASTRQLQLELQLSIDSSSAGRSRSSSYGMIQRAGMVDMGAVRDT